jgi:hypothetical protein
MVTDWRGPVKILVTIAASSRVGKARLRDGRDARGRTTIQIMQMAWAGRASKARTLQRTAAATVGTGTPVLKQEVIAGTAVEATQAQAQALLRVAAAIPGPAVVAGVLLRMVVVVL